MLNKFSFQNRIFIYYSLFISLVLLMMAAIFYSYISSVLQDREAKGMEQELKKISSGLDSFFKEMDVVSTQVLFSKTIQEIMSDADETNDNQNFFDVNINSANKARDVLVAINSPKTIVERIGIFNRHGSCMSVGKVDENTGAFKENLKKATWFNNIAKKPNRSIVLPPHHDDWIYKSSSPVVVSLIRELIDSLGSNTSLGYIEIQQPYSLLESICKTDDKSNMSVVVLDPNGNIVYPYNTLDRQRISYYRNLAAMPSTGKYKVVRRPWDKSDELVLTFNSSSTNLTTILSQAKADFMHPVYFIQNVLAISGVILITLTLSIMFLITRSLTSPIREMRKLVKNLSLENLSIDLSAQSGNNEVELLSEALTKTLGRLKESMYQTIQARGSEAHAYMLAFQAQMNPHFLYNTLMGISGAAGETGNRKVMEMCAQLSEMLRYVASFKNSTVVLGSEIKHAENYLRLNAWRYEEHLEYSIKVEDALWDLNVPKLILQPLVENCFAHGFINSIPPFRIDIEGTLSAGKWKISVRDNGAGFSEHDKLSLLDRMNKYKEELKTGGIFNSLEIGGMALINIYMRMVLSYGNEAIFEIDNSPSGGAIVTIGGSI